MGFYRRVAVIVAVALGLGELTVATAAGGTLSTSLLPLGSGQTATCFVSNVTDRVVRDVDIEFRGFDGGTRTPPGPPFDLSPQATAASSFSVLGGDHFRCVFKFPGSTSAIRGHLCISNGPNGACVSNSEAR